MYFFLAVYSLLLIGISVYLSRGESTEEFLIAGRKRKWWQILASKFSATLGADWLIVYTGYAYLYGWSLLSILPGYIISVCVFSFWAIPRIYKHSRAKKFITQGDFVLSETGSFFAKNAVDVLAIVTNLVWLITSIIGGAKVIDYLGVLNYSWALTLVSVVILIYIFFSGFKAVVITDIIQAIIVVVLLVFCVFVVMQIVNVRELLLVTTKQMSVFTMLSFFIFSLFSVFSTANRYQLIFSAKNKTEAKAGMATSIIPLIFIIFVLLLIGLFVQRINPNLAADLAFIEFLFSYMPAAFLSIGGFLFVAAVMSSADTAVYNIASYLAFLSGPTGNKVKQVRVWAMVLILSVSIFAYFVRDIIAVTIFSAAMALVPSVAMIYIIAGGRSAKKFLAILGFGVVGIIVGLGVFGMQPRVAVFPLVFSLLGFLVDSKFSRFFSRS